MWEAYIGKLLKIHSLLTTKSTRQSTLSRWPTYPISGRIQAMSSLDLFVALVLARRTPS
jgi:hypothetical protein